MITVERCPLAAEVSEAHGDAALLVNNAGITIHGASQALAELMIRHGARPEHVAERVLRAVRRNEAEVVIGWDAHLTTRAQALAPAALYGALAMGFRRRRRSS